MWLVVDNGYNSIFYVGFFTLIDLFNPVFSKLIWQSQALYFVFIQGVVLTYICILYTVRLTDLCTKRLPIKLNFILHAFILNISIAYMTYICDISGVMIIGLLVFKVVETISYS